MLTIERVVKNEEKIAFFRNMIVENNDFTDKVVLDQSVGAFGELLINYLFSFDYVYQLRQF